MEKWDLYTKYREKTGKEHVRGEGLPDGLFHLVVHAGSRHPSHKEMVYPVNYGYVDGVFAGDGAEQDVYVFGTEKPLDTYKGKVIAVFHRFNDVEDKLIVSLDGNDIPDEKILGDIYFQEQFFYGKLYR